MVFYGGELVYLIYLLETKIFQCQATNLIHPAPKFLDGTCTITAQTICEVAVLGLIGNRFTIPGQPTIQTTMSSDIHGLALYSSV